MPGSHKPDVVAPSRRGRQSNRHAHPHTEDRLGTGANKGIGFEVARQIARAGYLVLLGARKSTLGEQATTKLNREGLQTRFLPLDLTDNATIQTAAGTVAPDYATSTSS